MRAPYAVLPVLVVAVIVRMISAETLDFSLVLLLLSVATGLVWVIDHFVFRKRREAGGRRAQAGAARAAGAGHRRLRAQLLPGRVHRAASCARSSSSRSAFRPTR